MAAQGTMIHKGNLGEHLVAAALASHAIVRTPAQGRDVGVDLYCEGLLAGTETPTIDPLNHFWVQVKATEGEASDVPSFQTTRGEVGYWLQQPVPVYVIVARLPGRQGACELEVPPFAVFDITLWAMTAGKDWLRGQGGDSKAISLAPSSELLHHRWCFLLGGIDALDGANEFPVQDVKGFITSHVAYTYGAHAIRRGFVQFNPDKHMEQGTLAGGLSPGSLTRILARVMAAGFALTADFYTRRASIDTDLGALDAEKAEEVHRFGQELMTRVREMAKGLGLTPDDLTSAVSLFDRAK